VPTIYCQCTALRTLAAGPVADYRTKVVVRQEHARITDSRPIMTPIFNRGRCGSPPIKPLKRTVGRRRPPAA
jgi:hypothetical protein